MLMAVTFIHTIIFQRQAPDCLGDFEQSNVSGYWLR